MKLKGYYIRYTGTRNYYKVWATSRNDAKQRLAQYEGINSTTRMENKRNPEANDRIRAIEVRV